MRKLTGEKLEAELARLEGMRAYEHQYESAGIVCGIDEAGRGPLAGPVVAAVAVLPKGLYDSAAERFQKNCRKNAGKNYFWKCWIILHLRKIKIPLESLLPDLQRWRVRPQ